MRYLFIAEKKSLKDAVASVYAKHKSEIKKDIGEIDFIELAGHVCRLLEPSEYPAWDEKWKDIELPMVPSPFKIADISSKKKIDRLDKKRITKDSVPIMPPIPIEE